jgi:TusA-related sulfurtransferase
MAEHPAPGEFLEQLAARNYQRLAATRASAVHARMLLPGGPEEHWGRAAVVRRIQSWFGSALEFGLTSSSGEPAGQRHRLSWRLRVVRDGGIPEVVEQVAFSDLGPDGIGRIDLPCSGFQAEPGAAGGPAQVFDAGAMGCADGLAQEFRRRIAGVPVGAALEVVVSDPAAKQDLPSLAKLLGQRVTSSQEQAGGRLTITVERRK